MPVKPRRILKEYFKNGDKPDQKDFSDLIDSFLHINEERSEHINYGVVSNVGTNEIGDLVLTYTNGNTRIINNSGQVTMPVLLKKGYRKIFFVSEEKGDDNSAISNSFRYYKSIVKASEAAREDYALTGNKNLVYVFKGTYKEESVNRNHVDLFFEDHTVVWTEGEDQSVINDKLEPITNANVYGKGTFVNRTYDPGYDSEGINFRKATNIYIEAKLIDGIQVYNPQESRVELYEATIIYGAFMHENKTVVFEKCKFLNGCQFPEFHTFKGVYVFENCEFYIQKYSSSDLKNTTPNIIDHKGDLLFRIEPDILSRDDVIPELDISSKSPEEILEDIYGTYTNGFNLGRYRPEVACISFFQSNVNWFLYGASKIQITNSKLIIKRENGFGILLSKRRNGIQNEGYLVFNGLTIIDETLTKNTSAIGTARGDASNRQPELGINALTHNCKNERVKLTTPGVNEWEVTFKNFSATKDGVFEKTESNEEPFTWRHKNATLMQLDNQALTVLGNIQANGEGYFGDGKQIIRYNDAWLRLNPASNFTSGIYCGNQTLRTDGEFQVGNGGNKFKVESNGNTTVQGHLHGRSVDGEYSHLYRFGGVHFTWDSDSYGTQAQHAIKSAYGTIMGDSLTMNSFNNIRLNIDSNNDNTASKFEIGHNTSGVSNVLFSVDENGDAQLAGSIMGTSDVRLKKDIEPVETSFLDKIDDLNAKYYKWKDEDKKQNKQLGFIAQEVEKVFPEWVAESNDMKGISYDKMGAVLAVQCIKELKREVLSLKEKVEGLKMIINQEKK